MSESTTSFSPIVLACGVFARCRGRPPLLATYLLLVAQAAALADSSHLDMVMYRDPEFTLPGLTISFPDQLKPLWMKALKRPESEIVQVAADTIAIAHQKGMPGLADTAPTLIGLLEQPGQSPAVIRAAVHALVAMEAREAEDVLWKLARQGDIDLARLIEPALAAWNYAPARDQWLLRLQDPAVRPASLRLAIDGLATMGEAAAGDELLRLALRPHAPAPVRLASARAAIAVGRSDLVPEAKRLWSSRDRDPLAAILAATLLGNDSGPEALDQLRQLAVSPDATAAALAMQRLLDIGPTHLLDLTPDALRHTDVEIRRVAARALAAVPNEENVRALAVLLSDINPRLRIWTAARLVEFGQHEALRDVVVERAQEALAADAWRGAEQAMVVLARLDHKVAAPRIVPLLEHERPEVFITAAWALRVLQVPETLEPMLAKAQSRYEEFRANFRPLTPPPAAHAAQVSQLIQAFGLMKYREAEPLLLHFVTKILENGVDTRAAACWSLGYIYENEAPAELVDALIQRVVDQSIMNPEFVEVRAMSAVALARMKAQQAIEPLRVFEVRMGPNDFVGQACGWGLEQLTGEPRRLPQRRFFHMTSWFLSPILQ